MAENSGHMTFDILQDVQGIGEIMTALLCDMGEDAITGPQPP